MTTVLRVDYRPGPELDAELAELAYRSVEGWPDQRPLNAGMVRSLLRAPGMTATTLFVHRDDSGRLLGAGALRWPPTLEAPGRVWGPFVRPEARGQGIGRSLLAAMSEALTEHPGTQMVTTEIPGSRELGWSLFEDAGWHKVRAGHLYQREVPAEPAPTHPTTVRTARPGEYLNQALAELFAAVNPDVDYAVARDVFTQWSTDARYTPDGLLLCEAPDGLRGAALIYVSSNDALDDPAEALIAHVLVSPALDPAEARSIRASLVAAALSASAAARAKVIRAVTDCPLLTEALVEAEFRAIDEMRLYAPPGCTPRLPT